MTTPRRITCECGYVFMFISNCQDSCPKCGESYAGLSKITPRAYRNQRKELYEPIKKEDV